MRDSWDTFCWVSCISCAASSRLLFPAACAHLSGSVGFTWATIVTYQKAGMSVAVVTELAPSLLFRLWVLFFPAFTSSSEYSVFMTVAFLVAACSKIYLVRLLALG